MLPSCKHYLVTTPVGLAAFPTFSCFSALSHHLRSCSMGVAHNHTPPQSQSFSCSFRFMLRSFSMWPLDVFIPLLAVEILPCSSFTQGAPCMTCMSFAKCFAILKILFLPFLLSTLQQAQLSLLPSLAVFFASSCVPSVILLGS